MANSKSTATGQAIIDLAIKMMKSNRDLSLPDAKKSAKQEIMEKVKFEKKRDELRDRLLHGGIGQRLKSKVLVKLFGENVGTKIAELTRSKADEEKSADKLLEHELSGKKDKSDELKQFDKKSYKAERLPPKEIKEILAKLATIETDVKVIKTTRLTPEPVAAPRVVRSPHYADAAKALKAQGFKKDEIKDMLEGAVGNSVQDLFKFAMKPKAERIKITEAAKAVQTAKVENAPQSSQAEAVEVKKGEEESDRAKQDHEDKKKIMAELDDIEKNVKNMSNGGLLGALLGGLAGLLSRFFKPILAFFKPIWDALKGVGRWISKIVKGIANFMKKIPGMAKTAANFLTELVESGIAELGVAAATDAVVMGSTAYVASGKMAENIRDDTKKGMKAYGIEPILDQKGFVTGDYNINGKVVKGKDLTDEEKTVIDASQQYNPVLAKQAQAKIDKNPDAYKDLGKPKVDMLPEVVVKGKKHDVKKIAKLSQDNADMKADAAAPVIEQTINNDNRTINPPAQQQQNKDGGISVLNVRNMESSSASYISQIFNSPVTRLAM